MTWETTEGGLREYLRHFDTEDLVCYHSFWDQCPRCNSLNTQETEVSHPYTGVEVVKRCDNCGKEWMTKIYSSEWLEEEYGDYEDDLEESGEGET
jgi:transcription elongation factor Elf1